MSDLSSSHSDATSQPRISVVTVTFNLLEAGRKSDFERMIKCVQAQNRTSCEHVIQDGGSTDGTVAFIKELTSGLPDIRFESVKDDGLYDGMNRAALRARGQYLLFLNSDDALASDDVLRQAEQALASDTPDFMFGSAVVEDPETGQRTVARTNPRAVLQRMPFCHNSVFIRRDVFLALGGHDTTFPVAADYDLVLRLYSSGYQGTDLGIPISLFWTRGVTSDDSRTGRDYAAVWKRFFSNYPSCATLTEKDFEQIYHKGHMPLKLILDLIRMNKRKSALHSAAKHSLAKTLKRSVQPWRFR
ncbi:MAG: glycosyltransferase [Rhodobacteraceae bacterium]|nr:glycosyltransferase [Paracoccaceae bacterium]